ncbi:hypothetical protein, partial [Roseinatronobacter bogoriensis]
PTDPAEPTDPVEPTDPAEPGDIVATNVATGATFTTIAAAIAAASEGDEISIIAGSFDEALVIDKGITLSGANAGLSAKFMDGDTADTAAIGNAFSGEDMAGERGAETVLTGAVTVASENVTIDGVKFASDAPLAWDMDVLQTGSLDGFALLNSIVVGYTAEGAPKFNPDPTVDAGSYAGETVASNWELSGNLFGGMTSGNAGALYISGVAEIDISDNLFWRPTAGHMYLSSLEDASIENNFFFHGLHAGGANFDGLATTGDGPVDGYGDSYGDTGGYGDTSGYGETGGYGDTTGYGETGGYGDPEGYGGVSFGRNFWIELKGINDGITISGNDGQFNSGGIQIYAESEDAYHFANIDISGNTFRDFVNAAPEGLENDKSGFIGAISVSIANGESDGISITDNTITVAADQIFTVNDLAALIQLQGFLSGTTNVNSNTLTWLDASSDVILEGLSDLGVASSSYTGPLVALRLVGGLDGTVNVVENDFIAAEGLFWQARAIDIDGDPGVFGDLSASLNIGVDLGGVGTMLNSFEGFGFDVLFVSVPDSLDPNNLSINTQAGDYVATLYGEENTQVKQVIFGTSQDDTLTGTSANEVFFGGAGDDLIDLSAGGRNVVLFNSDPEKNGVDNVIGFTLGQGADADIIEILPVTGLRGDMWQMIGDVGTVGENVGFIVFTTALSELTAEAALNELDFEAIGLDPGTDPFIGLFTDGTDAALAWVNLSEASTINELEEGGLAYFSEIGDLNQFTGANLGHFEPYMGTAG